MSFLPSCAPCARSVQKSQQRPLCLLGLDLQGELPDTVLENLGPLQEEYVPLPAEPSLQPHGLSVYEDDENQALSALTMKVEQGSGEQRDLLLGHDRFIIKLDSP